MKKSARILGSAILFGIALGITFTASAREQLLLRDHWQIQSAAQLGLPDGNAMSRPDFQPEGWLPTSVPATVLAVLAANNVYPDPYFGTNLKLIPGYVDGKWLVMPQDSPFYPSWWYRTTFTVPANYQGKNLILHLDGINYRANVWLNGKKIADQSQVIGMFRRFEFIVNDDLKIGEVNCLALELIAPGKLEKRPRLTKQVEATTGWDDHNPQPPDLNLGVWQDVYITAVGPARLQYPYVASRLDLPAMAAAHLTVSVYVTNLTNQETTAELSGKIENISFTQPVKLAAKETKLVKFAPADYAQLNLPNPRVWWPHPTGPQELYELELRLQVKGETSDDERVRFGIREATTAINDEGWRYYMINGRRVLIRGGAWMTSDMMLRLTPRRYDALVRYAREADLNMLRSEGFSIRETEDFYDACDREGVMVTQQIFGRSIPDEALAVACVRDMILRIRNHPSLVHFLGHDETFPTPTLDAAYRAMIAELIPDRTYQPHSGAFDIKDRFKTGGTRTGTLELWTHAGPAHYYTHHEDGAWGFAQSGGIGGIVASEESIRRMIPADQLWPLWTEAWSFHTVIQGGHYFDYLLKVLNIRYGEPKDFHDFVETAHAMNYESARGMFEAYARNKYSATGLTTWKYDVAWPAAMTWAYVDWYLLPTGAYYGAKKACEPLHVQYSYDDNSIYVVNSFYREFKGLQVSAKVYNLDLTEKFAKSATVDVGSDGKTSAFVIVWPSGLSRTYFLSLKLKDAAGNPITDNFYWLSTVPDTNVHWVLGLIPTSPKSRMDLTGLRSLPAAKVELACRISEEGGEKITTVTVKNPGSTLAFFVNLAVTKGPGGLEVAPSYWSDNDVSLLPGEENILQAHFAEKELEGKAPMIRAQGWNVEKTECRP